MPVSGLRRIPNVAALAGSDRALPGCAGGIAGLGCGAAGLVVIAAVRLDFVRVERWVDALFAWMMAAPPEQMPVIVRAAPVQPPPRRRPRRTRCVGQATRVPAAGDRARAGNGARDRCGARGAGPQPRMFAAGSAAVPSKFDPLLQRIGQGSRRSTAPCR